MTSFATPDSAYIIMLLAKMAITMAIVVGSSFIVERTGPFIGGMIATLPISAGPSYVFLALDHDSSFIASAALITLTANASTMLFVAVYARMAQTYGLIRSLGIGWLTWGSIMVAFSLMQWSLAAAIAINIAAFVIASYSCRAYLSAPKAGLFVRRKWDVPLRALSVVSLVGIVIVLGNVAGPKAAGIAAPFPIVLSSLAIMLHPRLGGRLAAATLSNSLPGLAGFGFAIVTTYVCAIPLGSAWALSLALVVSVVWNAALVLHNRYKSRAILREGETR